MGMNAKRMPFTWSFRTAQELPALGQECHVSTSLTTVPCTSVRRIVAAGVAEGEPGVIQAEQVQDGGVEVGHA